MDKYELNVKVEQIKKLARQKDYAAASKIADSIDFYRIKENRTLSLLADVYEASGKYEQAKDILIEAYARTSLGRQLAYRLVKLCIKSGNVGEAEEFYQDFVEAAPRDNSKYILQYELATAKGESLENRISILETYLSDEMDEKWAFELAKLYHKTGQKDKCVRQCDDIILWFSEGKYVDKAMELKMIYAPLSKTQQTKYEERWMAKAPSNINIDDIKVKEYDAANRYNTVNIQNALKESMSVLMDEDNKAFMRPEKEDEKAIELEKTKVVFDDKTVNELLSHTVKDIRVPSQKYNTVPLSPLYDMDSNGQIELNIEEPVDDQIEGQMTIEELLAAYEEREAREAVRMQHMQEMPGEVQEAVTEESEEPEEMPEAVEEENEEAEELSEAVEEENEEAEELSEAMTEESEELNEPQEDVQEQTDDVSSEMIAKVSDTIAEEVTKGASYGVWEEAVHEDIFEETDDIFSVTADLSVIEQAIVEAAMAEAKDLDEAADEAAYETEDEVADDTQEDENISVSEKREEENDEESGEDELEDNASEDNASEEETVVEEQQENGAGTEERNSKSGVLADNNTVKELIKEFVSKYSGVQGLDRQLLKVLQEALINQNAHIIVMGEVKSGKTALAIDLVKIVNKIKQVRGRKIAKINGEFLNGKNVEDYFEKLSGMDLIIEKAGSLSSMAVRDIVSLVEKDSDNKIIVLEDEKNNATALLEANSDLDKLFSSRLIVKQNRIRDWAVVAKEYAREQGYEIDEMGMLALHAKIDELYAISLVINKSQVEAVVDKAIYKSGKRGLGRFLKIFGKEKEKILKEEDFS